MEPEGNAKVSEFINDPAIRFEIMWQRNMVHEIKDQKMKVEQEIKKVITEIEEELENNFDYTPNDK